MTLRNASCFLARFLAAASLAIFRPRRSLRPGSKIYKGAGMWVTCDEPATWQAVHHPEGQLRGHHPLLHNPSNSSFSIACQKPPHPHPRPRGWNGAFVHPSTWQETKESEATLAYTVRHCLKTHDRQTDKSKMAEWVKAFVKSLMTWSD